MTESVDERRLWIGNLDLRCNEYQLLKIVQKYGKIEKFDYLFHKAGPLIGQPRGYAFVTYNRHDEAVKAKDILHNSRVGSKCIVVTWAHSMPAEEPQDANKKINVHIPALALSKSCGRSDDKQCQIQAIEAKLKLMERGNQGLEINKTVATERPIVPYNPPITSEASNNKYNDSKRYTSNRHTKSFKPYDKYNRKNR